MYLAAPRTAAVVQGREDGRQRKQGRAEIGQRHAHLDWRPPGFARHGHQARDALRDQIESAFSAVGAGLSVS